MTPSARRALGVLWAGRRNPAGGAPGLVAGIFAELADVGRGSAERILILGSEGLAGVQVAQRALPRAGDLVALVQAGSRALDRSVKTGHVPLAVHI